MAFVGTADCNEVEPFVIWMPIGPKLVAVSHFSSLLNEICKVSIFPAIHGPPVSPPPQNFDIFRREAWMTARVP